MFAFMGFLFAGVFLVFCMLGNAALIRNQIQLQPDDFAIDFEIGMPSGNYTPEQLSRAKEIFVRVLNDLPEKEARENLISLIKSGKLRVNYSVLAMLIIFGPTMELSFDPGWILENQDNKGYIGSYIFHEHHHLQDWLGYNSDGMNYMNCELEGYRSNACNLEWWDAEWRALKNQAVFLRKHHCVDDVPIGEKINNRAIFKQHNPDYAALVFLYYNYYAGKKVESRELLDIFPEYYRNKLKEIN